MKNSFLLGSVLLLGIGALGVSAAKAQFNFTSGDLVIYQTGDGSAALSSTSTSVFLDQYTVAGTAAGSYNMTTAGTIPLVTSGSATSEGLLNDSVDGHSLLVTGYDAATGVTGIASTASTADPRIINTVSSTGGIVQTTVNGFSGNNIRSATTSDNSTLYLSGGTTGILSVVSGSGTSTVGATPTTVSTTTTTDRGLVVSGGNLYYSTGSGTTHLYSLGSVASPTATGTSVITTGGSSPYQFVLATLTVGGTSADTIYIADSAAGIEKYTLSGGSFTLTSTVALTGVTGLIGVTAAGIETLYATTPTGLYSLADTSGVGGTPLATAATLLASAGTNEAFRGLAFAPTAAVPEPSTYGLLLAGGLGFSLLLRRRAGSLPA